MKLDHDGSNDIGDKYYSGNNNDNNNNHNDNSKASQSASDESSQYNSHKHQYDRMVVADIPGIIEGAHLGRGLGRGFLRHVERCKILIHLIDATSSDPVRDYITINEELQLFSTVLANKPQIVVLSKIDLIPEDQREEILENSLIELKQVLPHKRLLTISAILSKRLTIS